VGDEDVLNVSVRRLDARPGRRVPAQCLLDPPTELAGTGEGRSGRAKQRTSRFDAALEVFYLGCGAGVFDRGGEEGIDTARVIGPRECPVGRRVASLQLHGCRSHEHLRTSAAEPVT
jgi:hypothetical protein